MIIRQPPDDLKAKKYDASRQTKRIIDLETSQYPSEYRDRYANAPVLDPYQDALGQSARIIEIAQQHQAYTESYFAKKELEAGITGATTPYYLIRRSLADPKLTDIKSEAEIRSLTLLFSRTVRPFETTALMRAELAEAEKRVKAITERTYNFWQKLNIFKNRVIKAFGSAVVGVTRAVFGEKAAKAIEPWASTITFAILGQTGIAIGLAIAQGLKIAFEKALKAALKKQLPAELWNKGGFKELNDKIAEVKKSVQKNMQATLNKMLIPVHAQVVAYGTAIGATIGGGIGAAFIGIGASAGAIAGAAGGAIIAELVFQGIIAGIVKVITKDVKVTYSEFEKRINACIDSKEYETGKDQIYARFLSNLFKTSNELDPYQLYKDIELKIDHTYFSSAAQNFNALAMFYQNAQALETEGIAPKGYIANIHKQLIIPITAAAYVPKSAQAILSRQLPYHKYLRFVFLRHLYYQSNLNLQYKDKYQKALDAKVLDSNDARLKTIQAAALLNQSKIVITDNQIALKPEPKITAENKGLMTTNFIKGAETQIKTGTIQSGTPFIITGQTGKPPEPELVKLPDPTITAYTQPQELTFAKVTSFYESQKNKIAGLKDRAKALKLPDDIINRIEAVEEKNKTIYKRAVEEVSTKRNISAKGQQIIETENLGFIPLVIAAVVAVAGATAVTANALSDYLDTKAETEKIEKLIEAHEKGAKIYQPIKWTDPKVIIPASILGLGAIGATIYYISKKPRKNPQRLTNEWEISNILTGEFYGTYKGKNQGEALNNYANFLGYEDFTDLAYKSNTTVDRLLQQLEIRRLAKVNHGCLRDDGDLF